MKFTGRIREPEKLTASFPALKLPLSGGYEEGYADGRTDGYTAGEQAARAEAVAHNAAILTDCNAVLPDKGVELADTLEQVPQRIGEIKAEPMWLSYMSNTYMMFRKVTFPENTEIVMDVPSITTNMSETFTGTKNITKIKLICKNADQVIIADRMIFESQQLRTIDLSEFNGTFSSFTQGISSCGALEEILGELSFTPTCKFASAFMHHYKLREIRFKKGTIHNSIGFVYAYVLSNDSVNSIIEGLADLTGATAQNLSFDKAVYDKLTDEQKDAVTAKNWTLVRA